MQNYGCKPLKSNNFSEACDDKYVQFSYVKVYIS